MDTTTSTVDHASSRFSGGRSSRFTGSNGPAAFFATAARAPPAELVVRLDGRLDTGLLHPDVPLDRLRDRVRDRVDALPVVDRDPRAADALELVDDLVDRDAGPQAQGNEARDAFREGGSISAAAADLREHFEEAFLVLVDRDVQGAVSG